MSRANTMSFSEIMIPNRPEKIDGFEYHPVCSVNDAGDVEQCEPEEAEFWSVYAHLDGWGLSCISDHKTEQEAKDFCEFLIMLLNRVSKEDGLDKLKSLVRTQLDNAIQYPEMDTDPADEEKILTLARTLGYDYELDEELSNFMLKATYKEGWGYWLNNVLPNFEKKKNIKK